MVTVIVILGLIASTFQLIKHERDVVISEAGVSLRTMAMVLSIEVESTLALASTILSGVIGDLSLDDNNWFKDGENLHKILIQNRSYYIQTADIPKFSHMFILNAEGRSIGNTVSYPVKKVSAARLLVLYFNKKRMSSFVSLIRPAPENLLRMIQA